MVSFEIFVKALPPSLSESKVLPSFYFAFKIPDDVAASNMYCILPAVILKIAFQTLMAMSFLISACIFHTDLGFHTN